VKIDLKRTKIQFGKVKDGIQLEGQYCGVKVKKEKLETLKDELEKVEQKSGPDAVQKKIAGFIMQHFFFNAPRVASSKEAFEIGAMNIDESFASIRDALFQEVKFNPKLKQERLQEEKKKATLKATV
jgi:hypothetical protein